MCKHFAGKTAKLSEEAKKILAIFLGDYYLCPRCRELQKTEGLQDGKEATT